MSNDLINNSITVSESSSNNRWNGTVEAKGLQSLLALISGSRILGNYYSDYDEKEEGCSDANQDRICDEPRKIGSGPDRDNYPSLTPLN